MTSDEPAKRRRNRPVGLLLVPTSGRGWRTLDGVVDAAVEVFGGAGDRRPSVAAVAERVGVSPAAVYQYFPDRRALVLAAVERDVVALVDGALAACRADGTPILAGGFMLCSLRLAAEHPLARRAVARDRVDVLELPLVRAAFDRVRDAFGDELERGQAIGLVRDDVSATVLAEALTTASVYTMWQEVLGPGPTTRRYESVAEVMRAALFHPAPDVGSPERLDAFRAQVRDRLATG